MRSVWTHVDLNAELARWLLIDHWFRKKKYYRFRLNSFFVGNLFAFKNNITAKATLPPSHRTDKYIVSEDVDDCGRHVKIAKGTKEFQRKQRILIGTDVFESLCKSLLNFLLKFLAQP